MREFCTSVPYDALSAADQEGIARLLADLGTRLLRGRVVAVNVEFGSTVEYPDVRFDEPCDAWIAPESGSFSVSVSFTLPGSSPSPPVRVPIPERAQAPVNDLSRP